MHADGTPALPRRAVVPPRPSLCAAGPCANYHLLVTQVDAAQPMAVRLPIAPPSSGAVYTAPAVYHVQRHHYCYPSPGIEMPLGDVPVVECNRWSLTPQVQSEHLLPRDPQRRRTDVLREHYAEVEAWERARTDEAQAAAEVERAIAASLAPYIKET